MLVDNPIINSPFDEPTLWWAYEQGQPAVQTRGRWLQNQSRLKPAIWVKGSNQSCELSDESCEAVFPLKLATLNPQLFG